jgi:Protein of unknown function (DUF2721)
MLESQLISTAVAPGVALTSSIFFTSGLQARFTTITGRVRELNREARGLNAQRTPVASPGEERATTERLPSIRRQVERLLVRVALVHRAILLAYLGTLAFAVTMLVLLVEGIFSLSIGGPVSVLFFAVGLGTMVVAVATSVREVSLARTTVEEDTRSSFVEPIPTAEARGAHADAASRRS